MIAFNAQTVGRLRDKWLAGRAVIARDTSQGGRVSSFDYDVIFVGGGLAAGLAASLLKIEQSHLRLLLLDAGRPCDWDQTWSFQALAGSSDRSRSGVFRAPLSSWLAPFISGYWDSYEVCFPERKRILNTPYVSIRYQHFIQKLQAQLGSSYRQGVRVSQLQAQHVQLSDGSHLRARCVIDARGWPEGGAEASTGYQKFVGLHIQTQRAHGQAIPIVMDACLPQIDGFRFMYVLPWADDELLLEDTHYSRNPDIDAAAYRQEILAYAAQKGWDVKAVKGEEQGVLPIPGYGIEAVPHFQTPVLGVRAGFFHPTTGYSIYEAVHIAEWLAEQTHWDPYRLARDLAARSQRRWKEMEFYRRLNNMLFFAADDDVRYKVLEKFYEHQEDLVARFFAGQTHGRDKLKILSGKPPVPVNKGIYHFFHKVGVSHGTT